MTEHIDVFRDRVGYLYNLWGRCIQWLRVGPRPYHIRNEPAPCLTRQIWVWIDSETDKLEKLKVGFNNVKPPHFFGTKNVLYLNLQIYSLINGLKHVKNDFIGLKLVIR